MPEDKGSKQHLDDMQRWFDMQSPQFKKKAKIVSKANVGYEQLFRIDKVMQRYYNPRMPRSAYSDENQDVPRISMSTSLMGCMLGYGRWFFDMISGTSKVQSKENEGYKGGYIIQTIDYEYAIQPHADDIWESPFTDELWLVNYSKDTAVYFPKQIGKMFIRSIKIDPIIGRAPDTHVELFIEHDYKNGLPLLRNKVYPPGYYKLFANYKSSKDLESGIQKPSKLVNCYDPDIYEIIEISKQEYSDAKKYTANMLSMPVVPECLKI